MIKILIIILTISFSLTAEEKEIQNSRLFRFGEDEIVLHEYLKSLKETELLVMNFTSVTCIPCKKEIPELLTLERKYPNMKLFIIFAEPDPSKFASGLGVKSFFADPLGSLQNRFGIKSYPTTFVVKSNKSVLVRLDGYNDKTIGKISSLLKDQEGK